MLLTVATSAPCGRPPARQQPFQVPGTHRLLRAAPRAGASSSEGAASGSGESGGSGSGSSSSELPPELQGLCISEDGQYLVDSKTGKVREQTTDVHSVGAV